MINRYMDPPKPVYKDLFSLVKDKDYFVITTNVDETLRVCGGNLRRFLTAKSLKLLITLTGFAIRYYNFLLINTF